MELFNQSLQNWQFFFSTVAAASATLTGLLFVSLSLNRNRLKDENAQVTISIARNTFGDFLLVLIIALVFLVPHPVPLSLVVALLTIGIATTVGMIVREVRLYFTAPVQRLDTRLIVRRIGLPSLASLGLIIVAIEVAQGNYLAIFGLVGVIAALLITACWNAWLLLLEE
jgi:hypothetical protein